MIAAGRHLMVESRCQVSEKKKSFFLVGNLKQPQDSKAFWKRKRSASLLRAKYQQPLGRAGTSQFSLECVVTNLRYGGSCRKPKGGSKYPLPLSHWTTLTISEIIFQMVLSLCPSCSMNKSRTWCVSSIKTVFSQQTPCISPSFTYSLWSVLSATDH